MHPTIKGQSGRAAPAARLASFLFALATLLAPAVPGSAVARGQFVFDNDDDVPGVRLDPDGTVSVRVVDARKELAAMRARVRGAAQAAKNQNVHFVSLPKLLAEARAAAEAGKDIPEAVRYLGGITRLQYVFVYPDEHDIVIGGPAEEWKTQGGPLNAFGKTSGRPVLHLEDLVVALRTAYEGNGRPFGCKIDPDPDSVAKAQRVAEEFARRPRKQRMAALAAALGPQRVSVFGTMEDTRFAFVCVAADYLMKRMALGLDRTPVEGVGHAVDNSRAAMNRFWFEAAYDPILVSPDGNSFELRGPRLKVQCGKFSFDPRDATEKAKAWAKRFDQKLPELSAAVPAYAELQNVADLSVLAALVRRDGLAERAGWDLTWVLDRQNGYPVTRVPVPRTAETAVNITSGSLAAGGVSIDANRWTAPAARMADTGDALSGPRSRAQAGRGERP